MHSDMKLSGPANDAKENVGFISEKCEQLSCQTIKIENAITGIEYVLNRLRGVLPGPAMLTSSNKSEMDILHALNPFAAEAGSIHDRLRLLVENNEKHFQRLEQITEKLRYDL